MFESESGCLLQSFSWHAGRVDALIELPSQIKQSICAECSSAKCVTSPHQSLVKNDIVPYQRVLQESYLQRETSKFIPDHYKSELHKSVRNLEAPLMISVGHDLADSIKQITNKSQDNCKNKSQDVNLSHDVILFTWTGIPMQSLATSPK